MHSIHRRSVGCAVAAVGLVGAIGAGPSASAGSEHKAVVATYNVRAAHLTAGPGGLTDGATRMRRSLAHLEGTSVSAVALQELEGVARAEIVADDDWGIYRARANTDSARWDGGNAIAWKKSVWTRVDAQQFSVSYTDLDGSAKRLWMPVVRLKNTANGESLTLVSIHNPGGPNRDGIRARAREQEEAAIRPLLQNRSHVVVAGDFNEVQPAACFFTRLPMKDATGYNANAGACPTAVPGHIDRVFGRDSLRFTGWGRDTAPLANGWSDHAIVKAYVAYW